MMGTNTKDLNLKLLKSIKMINVEKGSLWYRLALYGVFFEERNISPNLCPFMRRVIFGFVLATCYSFSGALLIICILTPPIQIVMVLLYGPQFWIVADNPAMTVGLTLWIMFLVMGFFIFMGDTAPGKSIRETTTNACRKIDMEHWLIIEWISAIHNKICPSVSFNGKIIDGYITKTEKEINE